jgi:hypothetical protein
MRRERIEKKPANRPDRHLEVLPLDARDADVVRAKELVASQLPPRRPAA